ncbi:MAG TPA: FlgD immunoglobulin-like domain containing protein [Gaiellaceae bacterium]|nr:FlgD immunoglobulin-like domain containing protein [Gaiellaceae bacterium]
MKRLLPIAIVVALLVATAAAFAVTERLKLEDSPILNTRLDTLVSPVCTVCRPVAREAQIRFRLRTEDELTIDILDADGEVVRNDLVSGRYRPAFLRFSWDGRDRSGRVVPDGLYRVRLTLEGEDRTLEFPTEIRVDATAPTIENVAVRPFVFSPDGDGRADQVNVAYRFSEGAYPVLYVDGRRRPPGFRRRPIGVVQWYALVNGRGLPAGTHRLALAAQDQVGNLSPSTREFTVRIRYVELRRSRYVVRAGSRARLRVSTDASSVRYRLAGPGGIFGGRVRARGSVRAVVFSAPQRPGRYVLTVRANGRLDRAALIVRR